jgi:hypothetical protein
MFENRVLRKIFEHRSNKNDVSSVGYYITTTILIMDCIQLSLDITAGFC